MRYKVLSKTYFHGHVYSVYILLQITFRILELTIQFRQKFLRMEVFLTTLQFG